jgi:methylglutaconyl-CoA hydratase
MKFRTLKIKTGKEVLNCWLNRPGKRNALNLVMLAELVQLFRLVEEDRKVRIFVLRGSGEVFSAGADLSMMSDVSVKNESELKAEAGLFFDCFDGLHRLPVPTICYAHGGVHGGANGLVAACDYALADAGTQFSFREVSLGLVPATVAPFVVRRTGLMHARRMMLWGQVFGGEEALEAGLVDLLCTPGEAGKKIDELCGQILRNAPDAVSETKNLLISLEDPATSAELKQFCTGLIARTRLSAEAREGIAAFFEKREPAWRKGTPGKTVANGDQ